MATLPHTTANVTQMVVSGATLFWRNSDGSIYNIPIAGGTPSAVASAPPFPTSAGPSFQTPFGAHTYQVFNPPSPSQPEIVIETGQAVAAANFLVAGLAVDGTGVYWIGDGDGCDTPDGFLYVSPLNPPAAQTILRSDIYACSLGTALATDSSFIYWLDNGRQLRKLRKPGR